LLYPQFNLLQIEMELNYNEILKQNEKLKAQIVALNEEIELLRKPHIPNEKFFKDRFYHINESVNDVVYRFHIIDRRYEYISPQVIELFGYDPEDFFKSPFLIRHIVHPDCMASYAKHWRNALDGQIPEYFEIKIIKRNGDIRWVMQKNLAIYNKNNKVEAIEGIVTDITERKNTEQALIESEAQKKAILNSVPHLAWMKNCEGVYLSVNKPFLDKYKKDDHQVVGKTDYDIYDDVVANRYRDQDLQVISKKEQLFIEEKSGDTYWETTKAPIFDSLGEVIGITGVALDITDYKKKEEEIKGFSEKLAIQNVKQKIINEELRIAKEKAEQADHLKSAFLANMSHEVRTPMNAILGFTTLLRNRNWPENKQIDFINIINANCRQLLHIISDIIDISKIESDQITIFNKTFNINSIFSLLKVNFENNIKSIKKDIEITLELDLPDEKAHIISDKVRLEQILTNLLSNAVKFTDKGKINCGYTINKNSNEIVFFVKDSGIGMTTDEQEVIFDRFRQVSSSYNKVYGGTGLGLSISKGLAQRLGGTIRVESEVGEGSNFFLTLPYKVSSVVKQEKIPYATKYIWKGYTILIAEDEKANYTLLESIIQPTGAEIIWVKNGIDAIDACKNNKSIDLVLMDIKMPDLNGLEATKQIRKFDITIPIIAQTAFAMPHDEESCLSAGCNDYFAKPLQVENILDKINQYIGSKRVKKKVARKNSIAR
jgi:PAS domain S-box-containing protein